MPLDRGSSDYESRPEVGRKRDDDSDAESNENLATGGDMTYAGPRRIPSPTGSEYDPPLESINPASKSGTPDSKAPNEAAHSTSTSTSFVRKPLGFASLGPQPDQTPGKGLFRVQGYVNDHPPGGTTAQGLYGSGPYSSIFRAGEQTQEEQPQPQSSIMLPNLSNIEPIQRAPSRAQSQYTSTPAPIPDYNDDHFGALPPFSPSLPPINSEESSMPNDTAYLQTRVDMSETTAATPAHSHPTPPARVSSPASSSRSVARGSKQRLLTLLIEDKRTGVDELAEIKVPLKADGTDGGWWADARDISRSLQSGPSRIDGPAKVFTMRGKYRQAFLRVSETNEDTTQSANLKVEKDKTLKIFVDSLHPPMRLQQSSSGIGESTAQPTFMAEPASLPSPISTAAPQPPSPFSAASPGMPSSPGPATKRKRMSSVAASTYSHQQPTPFLSADPTSLMPQPSPPKKSKRAKPPRDASSFEKHAERERAPSRAESRQGHRHDNPSAYGQPPTLAIAPTPSSSTHTSTAAPAPSRRENPKRALRCIAAHLRSVISQDADAWRAFVDFLQARAASPAQLVAQYWFVQGQMEKFVHSWSPMDLKYGAHTQIELEHVAAALDIKAEWYEECRETLALLLRYGSKGTMCQDERVVAAATDTALRVLPERRPTELLELLRRVHEQWSASMEGHRSTG